MTGRGGYKTGVGGGGQVKFTPTERGHGKVLTILKGGNKGFHPSKQGA